MSSRTARFVSAIFVVLIAGASFVTASHGAPADADKCLSGPKGAAPAGGHWYYRVDRATKRACWYVGEARQKLSRTAAETSRPAANPAPPPDSAGTPPSIANARAELPLPQARVEPDTTVFTTPRPLATVGGAIGPDSDQRANPEVADAQTSVVASRWVLADASPLAGRPPSTDNARAPAASSTAAPTPSRAAPAAALPLAAVDASPEKTAGSVHMLLIAILGALALAGLLASAIFKFGGARRNGRRGDRRVNWDSVRTDRPSLSDEARATRSMREPGLLPQVSLPRELRAADDPDERIAQLLSRLPRSSAT